LFMDLGARGRRLGFATARQKQKDGANKEEGAVEISNDVWESFLNLTLALDRNLLKPRIKSKITIMIKKGAEAPN